MQSPVELPEDLVTGRDNFYATVAPGMYTDETSVMPKDMVPPHYQDGRLTHDVPEDGTDTADFPLLTRR